MDASDEDLVRQVLQGDKDAFRDLYERYKDKVFATAFRILGNHEEAVDVAQDVFVKVYHDLEQFQFASKFSTWLYRVAVNFSINRANERERHSRIEMGLAREREARSGRGDERDELVQRAIMTLNPKLRAVVVLRYLQGLSYDEIAQALDLSIGTVKSRLHLAHEALREVLEPQL